MHLLGLARDAFHHPETRIGRATEAVVSALIAVSVLLLVLELAAPAAYYRSAVVRGVDRAILVVFTLELIGRVVTWHPPTLGVWALSPGGRLRAHLLGRLRYLLRPLVLIDLFTVLGAVPGLRGLRAIRLLRLFRGARVLKYSSPFEGLQRAFQENAVLYAFGIATFGVTVLVGAISFFLSEVGQNPSIRSLPDALWWSVVTVTTVGYGDLTPVTTTGRVVAAVLMVSGMITLALFAGIVGSSLMGTVLSLRMEAFRMSETVGHVVVCGYQPGSRILLDALLRELGTEQPIVLFADGERPHDVPPDFQWIHGDPTKESELDKVRLGDAAAMIVVGSRAVLPQIADAWTLLVVFTARRYLRAFQGRRKRPVYVVAEILDSENVDHARTAGADEVVETRRIGFHLLAHAVRMPGTAALVAELADIQHHSVFVAEARDSARYGELAARLLAEHGVALIGIRDPHGYDHIAPGPALEVHAGCKLLYIADRARLD